MRKVYIEPEVDIELFAFAGEVYTTSDNLENNDNDYDFDGEF